MHLFLYVEYSPTHTFHSSDGTSPFPKPVGGAVIALPDGRILGKGRSDHKQDALLHAISGAGLSVVPLNEWVVSWSSSPQLRQDLKDATLYLTNEPSSERSGDLAPSFTALIAQCGFPRVVIGCADPVPEKTTEGAAALHKAGLQVVLGFEEEECEELNKEYAALANTKLQRFSRKHFARTGQVSLSLKQRSTFFYRQSLLTLLSTQILASWFLALLSGEF